MLVAAIAAVWKYGFWETWSTVKSWMFVLTMGGLALGFLVTVVAGIVLLFLGVFRRGIASRRFGRATVRLMERVSPGRLEALPRGRTAEVAKGLDRPGKPAENPKEGQKPELTDQEKASLARVANAARLAVERLRAEKGKLRAEQEEVPLEKDGGTFR